MALASKTLTYLMKQLNYKFDHAIQLCRECGFREVQVLTKEGFKGIALD